MVIEEKKRGDAWTDAGLSVCLKERLPVCVCVCVCVLSHIPFNVCDGEGGLLQFNTLAQVADSPSVFFLHEVQPQLFRNTSAPSAFLFFPVLSVSFFFSLSCSALYLPSLGLRCVSSAPALPLSALHPRFSCSVLLVFYFHILLMPFFSPQLLFVSTTHRLSLPSSLPPISCSVRFGQRQPSKSFSVQR